MIQALYTKDESRDRFSAIFGEKTRVVVERGFYFFMEKNFFFPNEIPGFFSSKTGDYIFFARGGIFYLGQLEKN